MLDGITGNELVSFLDREGPETTIFRLYELYDGILLKNAVKHLNPPCLNPLEHSHDVKQETWLSAFIDLKRFVERKKARHYDSPLGWLLTINRNQCYGHLRTYQKQDNHFQLNETEHHFSPYVRIPTPLDGLIEEETTLLEMQKRREVLNIIALMPVKEQRILRMFSEGMSHKLIAAALDITPVNSRKILSRALDKLQRQIGGGEN
jgi:RNA polymerase sigma factor (sigma-70 family)